ncbi:MAG: hypothetical protein WCH31_08010 [Actinomycetes bacterium]
MSVLLWFSLVVGLGAFAAGLGVAGMRAIEAWRAFRSLRRRTTDGIADVFRRLGQIETRLATAGATATELDEARARLSRTLERASILAAAASDARLLTGSLRGFIPTK